MLFGRGWQIDTSSSKEIVFKIAKQQEKYAASGDIKDKYSDEILADLLANADRRADEGNMMMQLLVLIGLLR